MERKKYKSETRAKNKWNGENYDRLYPYVKLGKKAVYQRAVEAAPELESMNELIEAAADEWTMHILGLTQEEFAEAVKVAAEEERRKRGKQG